MMSEIAVEKTNNENSDQCEKNGVEDNINPCIFDPKEVLKTGRFACVQGEINGKSSLLVLEHNEFIPSDLLSKSYYGVDLEYEKILQNDIYSRYIIYPKSPYNGIKASLISPCTQKHIDKYKEHSSVLIKETSDYYKDITLPHLLQNQFNLQWLYNIFSGEKEAERVIYRDDDNVGHGFVLLPDIHWDGIKTETLHLLAIPFQKDIFSIRSLNENHLKLLYHIRDKSLEIIKSKYGLASELLRMYFHYQPTFYHLHVHITFLRHEAPGIFTEKAHMLDTVINNIEIANDYYQRATIPFTVRDSDALYDKYKDAGIIETLSVKKLKCD